MDGSMYTQRNKQINSRNGVYELVLTGIMAGLVLAATSFFKIPVPATNGYIHLGDALIFISVIVLGRRDGTIAAASGSALADLLGGYAHWAPWTFVIKGLMAFVAATIYYSLDHSDTSDKTMNRVKETAAFAAGGLVMMAGYFIAQRVIYGTLAAPLAALPGNVIQAACGVIIAEAVSVPLSRSGIIK